MRTIKLKNTYRVSLENDVQIETEVILENDNDAREEGSKAWTVIREILAGMTEAAEQ
jgi:hypothetical protein